MSLSLKVKKINIIISLQKLHIFFKFTIISNLLNL